MGLSGGAGGGLDCARGRQQRRLHGIPTATPALREKHTSAAQQVACVCLCAHQPSHAALEVPSASPGSAEGGLAARMVTCRCDFARTCSQTRTLPAQRSFLHAKSAAALLRSPLHPTALTFGLHRWLRMVRRRRRRSSLVASTPTETISQCKRPNLHRGGCITREKRRRTPALAIAPTNSYIWLAQVVAHDQAAQSAALPGRIDARSNDFTVQTAKSAQGRV